MPKSAQVWSYDRDYLREVKDVQVPDDFDEADPYGGTLGFALGSNQRVVTDPNLFKEVTYCKVCMCGMTIQETLLWGSFCSSDHKEWFEEEMNKSYGGER